jgi:hypothetical protein
MHEGRTPLQYFIILPAQLAACVVLYQGLASALAVSISHLRSTA